MKLRQEAVCTECGWYTLAIEGNLFIALMGIGACPNCGTKIETTQKVYPVEGEPFIVVDVAYIHRPVWYSPRSWFTLKRKIL